MRKNESGRSMVEMLGVLAIIGVLSIGGIAGYTLSMNRYRANAIVDAANKYASLVFGACESQKAQGASSCTVPEFAKTGLTSPETGVSFSATAGDGTKVPVTITFTGGKSGVSAAVASVLGEDDASAIAHDFKQN